MARTRQALLLVDEAKPYNIEYEERDGYLYASISGPHDTVAISRAYWNDIADECRRRGIKKMLVVEAFEESASMMDAYAVAVELPGILRGIKTAFLDRTAADLEANLFAETVAVNRGAIGKVFREERDAVEWLVSSRM